MLVRRFYFNVNNNLLVVFLFLSSFSSLSTKLLVRPTDGQSSSQVTIFSLKNQLKSITTLESMKKRLIKKFSFLSSFSSRSILLVTFNMDSFFNLIPSLFKISNLFILFFCYDRFFLNLNWSSFEGVLKDSTYSFKVLYFLRFFSFKVLLSLTKTKMIV